MSWFHTEHTLTVNLHPLTAPIHHHSGYVWAYTVHRASLGSAGYYFKGCCDITDHLVALWYLESNHKQFSEFFFFLILFIYFFLMKGHKISGRCEREKKSEGWKRQENWGGVRRDEKMETREALEFKRSGTSTDREIRLFATHHHPHFHILASLPVYRKRNCWNLGW